MGGTYNAPSPEPMSQVLSDYTRYLPGLMQSTGSALPQFAQNQFNATMATQPLYNALNLQQAQNYALPLAQVGQQVTEANALAGGQTNLRSINGPGGAAALAAGGLARASNPNYYGVQDAASSQARNLMNSFNMNGLSPGEANAVERSNNRNLTGSGNLGLINSTNTVSNAMNFGDAYGAKQQRLGQALGAANQTATSAQNTGFNPVNIALGQPNSSTMGNFGTGTFSPTNAGTQGQAASGGLNFGSSALGSMSSMNNAATQGAYGLAQANSIPAYMGSMPSYS